MQDPTYPLFSIFAFFGFLLCLVPLPWHLQAWNAGTCAYMIWASLACLAEFVNSVVWRDTAINFAPVWCDISSKFILGAGVGIPAASLCISRRLYNIAAVQTVSITKQDKRRAVIGDLAIAVGIPVLVMILHYVVQGHRFDILEQIGCYPTIFNTLPAYFLVFMWPVLLGSISFVYSALTLRAFWRRRMQFSELVSSSTSLNASRYLRLMVLASMEMMCTIPLGIYSIYIGTKGVTLAPWISWSDTHFDFSRVDQIPAFEWRDDHSYVVSVELTRWLFPVSALVFFALFGFANEAQKNYRLVFWWIAKRFGIVPRIKAPIASASMSWRATPKLASALASAGSLPVYVPSSSLQRQALSPESSTSSFRDNHPDVDVEKSAGLSSSTTLPHYEQTLNSPVHQKNCEQSDFIDVPIDGDEFSDSGSSHHISISETYGPDSRSHTPTPLHDPTIPRTLVQPSIHSVMSPPHPGDPLLQGVHSIQVVVHTQSQIFNAD